MGGGGGGPSLTPREFEKLARVAKEALRQASEPRKRNIFISFASEDLDEVNLLRGQAKNENAEIEFNDWSVTQPFDSRDAEYIRRGIRERIRQSSVTLVYLSEHTAQSRWVDWEIRESLALGKGVLAVYKGDTPPTTIPEAVTKFKIRLIPWRQAEISQAIEALAKD